MVDVEFEPTTYKKTWSVDDGRHFFRNEWGISPFDHLQKVNQ